MVRAAVTLLVLLWSAVRRVPGDAKAIAVFPHLLPNIGVGRPEIAAARLEDGGAAINCDLKGARRVPEKER